MRAQLEMGTNPLIAVSCSCPVEAMHTSMLSKWQATEIYIIVHILFLWRCKINNLEMYPIGNTIFSGSLSNESRAVDCDGLTQWTGLTRHVAGTWIYVLSEAH